MQERPLDVRESLYSSVGLLEAIKGHLRWANTTTTTTSLGEAGFLAKIKHHNRVKEEEGR